MRSSLCVSSFIGAALISFAVFAQEEAGKRANELTLAGLRPGRDTLEAALKRYTSKYASEPDPAGIREWRDPCTGRSLELTVDARSLVRGITVSSLGPQDGKCDDGRFDALDMQSWVSGRGLRLGDPQGKVIEIYGEPNSTGPSVKEDKELVFLYYAFDGADSDMPQVMEIYCARDTGRVVEITLAYPSL